MQKNLVIVESPAKAKTIEKFLGNTYKVLSSYGHIRDLKKKGFGIEIENQYNPLYEITPDKQKLVDTLRSEAKKSETVWLASDEDREGEAIAWHLYEVLGLKPEQTKRIVFHEITKNAILEAIAHPRAIDMHRVDAQQARRVLDRIVGFELSPVLWKKVKPALSAGRVQSVTVRLIVEREREVESFTSEAYYRVVALFGWIDPSGKPQEVRAELSKRLNTKAEAEALLQACKTADFSISDISVKPARKSPAPPFTTSTLQQEAARKLGFTVSQTMMVAQRLYESGHITYMRTDSVNLSSLAINAMKTAIAHTMGERYLHVRNYHTKSKGAQEAHEAIRPSYIENRSIEGTAQEKRLYDLIWKRAIASQMSDAELQRTVATITASGVDAVFEARGEVLTFEGFLSLYRESYDDDSENEGDHKMLPPMELHQSMKLNLLTATERFTQRPPRYTEASLVRKLEELGIGRPSTYAPTISTIQQRGYVEKGDREGTERPYLQLSLQGGAIAEEMLTERIGADKGKLLPTDIGCVVNDFLTEHFPDILNYNFTAQVEETFDDVAQGGLAWQKAIDDFYRLFHPVVESALALRTEQKVGERKLGVDPKSGRPVSVKIGRFGPVAQIGTAEDEEKPLFASLQKGQSLATISLEEALKLFELPRTLGQYEEKTVTIGVGRFGPYVRHDNKYVSLPKEFDPLSVTLEEAETLILQKREQESKRLIKGFEEEPGLQVLNGRYGAYIAFNKKNYKLPKTVTDPTSLTLETCREIIRLADEKETSAPKKRAASRKKAATKK